MIFSADEDFAKQLDAEDPLRSFRDKFHLPLGKNDKPLIYFAGNSLGLMPKWARQVVDQELDDWAKLGVDAHLEAKTPWYSYHETLREPTTRLIGAKPVEVICMNSLTVNLHLMMATFYRPTKSRVPRFCAARKSLFSGCFSVCKNFCSASPGRRGRTCCAWTS